jgi:MtN3 and saliva related transmembrane protein
MGMLVTFTTGVALWLLYGIALNSMPMMVSNGITLVLGLILVGLKYRHR